MNEKSKRLDQIDTDIKQAKTDLDNEISPTREAAKKEIYKALEKEKVKIQKEYDKLVDKKDKIIDKIDEAEKLPDTILINKKRNLGEIREYTINW
jgi:vacuolar-type H+-ATPase subunit H